MHFITLKYVFFLFKISESMMRYFTENSEVNYIFPAYFARCDTTKYFIIYFEFKILLDFECPKKYF